MPNSIAKRAARPRPSRIRNGALQIVRPKYDGLKMSLRDFLDWQPEADGWKYEWNNGRIEINEHTMKNTERYIALNLLRHFERTLGALGGGLLPETDCMLPSGQMRRPDLAYFSADQIAEARRGENPVPTFVIELISPTDRTPAVDEKLIEYFTNGVRCAWYIYPTSKRIHIYTSPKDIRICTDTDLCSAAPALDFSLTVEDIFA
jgi:Uma2 family endonuclease